MPEKKTNLLDAAIDFGSVSIGDETASIGFTVERSQFQDLEEVGEILCSRRLDVEIFDAPKDEAAGQQHLPIKDTVTGVCDTKRISVGTENISAKLSFARKDVDLEAISSFAKRSGRLRIKTAVDIPDEKDAEETE